MGRPPLGDVAMTNAEKQAKRREQFRRMREALERILDDARTIKEAREIARTALTEPIG